jgi:hypothetical protein
LVLSVAFDIREQISIIPAQSFEFEACFKGVISIPLFEDLDSGISFVWYISGGSDEDREFGNVSGHDVVG